MISSLFWIAPISAVLALFFAWIFYRGMMKAPAGNDRMQEIAQYVREGAMAYLKSQYKVVGKVFIILVILLTVLAYLGVQNPFVPVAFLTGGFFSGLCGLPRDEDGNTCLIKNCPGRLCFAEQGSSDCIPQRCCDGLWWSLGSDCLISHYGSSFSIT